MADVDVMAAIIQKHAVARVKGRYDLDTQNYLCSDKSVNAAAQALYEAGFRMSAGIVDRQQNERLRAVEGRLDRIEGYMVLHD